MKNRLLFLLLLVAFSSRATHNRAGEITYRWLGGLNYEVTITTYARLSVDADRCELTINWGDNSSQTIPRVNGPTTGGCATGNGVPIGNDIKLNIYKGQHTYPSAGVYVLFFQDPNRNDGVRNIPNSVQVPFYVQSELFISPAIGGNSSPILTNPPVDNGCQLRRFEHNPGAYDPDGDSLYYTLVPCRTTNGVQISSTYDPALVSDSIKINEITGDLFWDVPQNIGQYNMAIRIEEYRQTANGPVRVGYVVRDMQVDINPCVNRPPIIEPVKDYCVEAGKVLQFPITAFDPDYDSTVTLTAFGGPFEVQNPAAPVNLISSPTFLRDSILPRVSGFFTWLTACNHVRKAPYFVTLNATDAQRRRVKPDPLTDVFTFQITVVGPAPKNPLATANAKSIQLNWDASICTEANGYKIYRKVDTAGFVPDTCETGVPAYTGYTQIGTTSGLTNTSFIDSSNLVSGLRYCYMVVACYPDGAESYASVEFCANLPLVQPLITNADVLSTDVAAGEIEVKWIAPPVIDSTLFPPPYSYRLLSREDETIPFQEIATLPTYDDTFFVHTGLNTQDISYQYKVEFYSAATLAAQSDSANSLYLTATPQDEAVLLSVNNRVPWLNERFVVFRENPINSGNFDSIGQTNVPTYLDTGLINGETYCYYIKSVGRYTANDSLPKPLINNSQRTCASPIDTTKPCAPVLGALFNCPKDSLFLAWEYPDNPLCTEDVVAFNVYYKETAAEEFGEVPLYENVTDLSVLQVNQGSIVGCYAITAVDDAGNDPGGQTNESDLSNIICIEACPVLDFPNVFTPNGDNFNPIFKPTSIKDIGELNLEIFNRWGTLVFSSSNIDLFIENGWDGTDQNTGKPLAEGVYFYTADYTPKSLQQAGAKRKQGFVHLKR